MMLLLISYLIEVEDADFKPPEAELDEYHPKSTRTLFVGNLEKDISSEELRDIFSEYGEIIVSQRTLRFRVIRYNYITIQIL